MNQTSRELVTAALRFETPDRLPRDLWTLPIGEAAAPEILAQIRQRFPSDFGGATGVYRPSDRVQGDPHAPSTYTDEWGCVFVHIQAGVIGEVRDPLIGNLISILCSHL